MQFVIIRILEVKVFAFVIFKLSVRPAITFEI